jgi:hypothetical protein
MNALPAKTHYQIASQNRTCKLAFKELIGLREQTLLAFRQLAVSSTFMNWPTCHLIK